MEEENFWFSQDKYVQAADVTSSTADGTEYYAFPTSPDLLRPDSLRILISGDTDPYPLIRDHWQTIERLAVPSSVSTGRPIRYAVRGERVRLYPIPDGTHTLYWAGLYRPSTELTTSSADNATNIWMTEGARLVRNRAKKTVARDDLKDGVIAAAAEAAEMDALEILRMKTTRRLMTGRNRAQGPGTRRRRVA